MSGYQAGILLRLLGPLIEIVSVLAFVQYRGRGVRLLGFPIETLCWTGFGLGLVLVVTGLGLTSFRPRRRKPSRRFDLDLGPDEPSAAPKPEADPWREL
jgi:hypothetical protein